MAISNDRSAAGVIFHSDRGSQYASFAFLDLLRVLQIRQSMSDTGNCYDNACAEAFFATIKKELIHRRRFLTRAKAALAIVTFVVTWYNP